MIKYIFRIPGTRRVYHLIFRARFNTSISKGYKLLDEGKYDQAKDMFKQAESREPALSLLGVARSENRRGRNSEAYKVLTDKKYDHIKNLQLEKEKARSLLEMYRFKEAEKICNNLSKNKDTKKDGMLIYARLAARAGDHNEALLRLNKALNFFPKDVDLQIEKALMLVHLEKNQEAIEFLTTQKTKKLYNYPFLIGASRALMLAGEYDQAIETLDKLIKDYPSKHEAYSLAVQCYHHKSNIEEFNSILDNAPKHLFDREAFIADTVIYYSFHSGNWDMHDKYFKKYLDMSQNSQKQVFIQARYYMRNFEFDSVIELLDKNLKHYKYNIPFHNMLMAAYFRKSDVEKMSEIKTSMKNNFGINRYYSELIKRGLRFIDDDEFEGILNWILEDDARKSTYLSDLIDGILVAGDTVKMKVLVAKSKDKLSMEEAIRLEGVQNQIKDIDLVHKSFIEQVKWHNFEENRDNLVHGLEDKIETLAKTKSGLKNYYDKYKKTVNSFSADFMFTRESIYEASEFSKILIDRIINKTPTSLLRLGDGEGIYLPYKKQQLQYKSVDEERIQKIWWGESLISESDAKKMEEELVKVINNTDIVGVSPYWRIIQDLFAATSKKSVNNVGNRGLQAIVDFMNSNEVNKNAILVSSAIHNDLYFWNLYRQIFSHTDSVSYVSCHNLEPFLKYKYGVSSRQKINIPPEHAFKAKFNKEENENLPKMYPDIFNQVMNQLKPQKGEVYLVAAGFLGKFMCNKIKNDGGIAIDIGSAADYWMGHETRRYKISQELINPKTGMITEHPLKTLKSRAYTAKNKFDKSSLHSSFYFDFDIAENKHISNLVSDSHEAERDVKIIGHPRCGSGYIAQVFTELGCHIGHEKISEGGICSWMYTAKDNHIPYGDNATINGKFKHTVAFVRDPQKALPSIVLENMRDRSFHFRRKHIISQIGIDIANYTKRLDRAVASYVYWMKLVEMQKPEVVMRVEDGKNQIEDFLNKNKLGSITKSHIEKATKVSTKVNSSDTKFNYDKPNISVEEYDSLDESLKEELKQFCDRYNYNYPKSTN